jgi:hypothetical protein
VTVARKLVGTSVVLTTVASSLLIGGSPASADVSGPNAFYFLATCTGLGDVTFVNPARAKGNDAAQVVGSTAVLVLPSNEAPGLARLAEAAGTTCDIYAAGFAGDIQPLSSPVTIPVLIR